jgi:hypothetical protein
MFCPGGNNPGGASSTDLFLKKYFIEVNWPKAQTHLAASFVMLSMWFTHHLVFLAPHDNADADDEVDSLGVRSEGEGVFSTQEPQMSYHGAGGSGLTQATGPSYSASHSGREDEEAAAAEAEEEEEEEEEEEDMVEHGHSHSLHLSRFHLAGCMLVCLVRARVWLVRLSQTVWVTPIGHA